MIQAMERIRRYTKGCHHARSPHFRTANFNVSERMIVGVILDKKISIDKNIFVYLLIFFLSSQSVWKTVPSEARVTRDVVSGLQT